MDLLFLRLDRRAKHGLLRARDQNGEQSFGLEGEAYERVARSAQPLFDWAHGRVPPSARTPQDSTLVAFEVDAIARSLRLGYLAERNETASHPTEERGRMPAINYCSGDYAALHTLLREAARTAVREVRPRLAEPAFLLAKERWEYCYQNGSDGWDLGRVAPPLLRFFTMANRRGQLLGQGERALVIGCGRGHEALAVAESAQAIGASVVAIDIAKTAVRLTNEAAAAAGLGSCLRAYEADFIAAEAPPVLVGAYDLIVEHTCFCAIEAEQRDAYFAALSRLLLANPSEPQKSGRFLGLFYCHDYPGGPPYGSTVAELREQL